MYLLMFRIYDKITEVCVKVE